MNEVKKLMIKALDRKFPAEKIYTVDSDSDALNLGNPSYRSLLYNHVSIVAYGHKSSPYWSRGGFVVGRMSQSTAVITIYDLQHENYLIFTSPWPF